MTDIWFKRVIRDQNKYFDTNFRHWKMLSCHDLGYQMSIFFFLKTVYQIKAFNLFFIMEFTSWKYLITFKSYTNKRTENTCPGFPPLKNTVLSRFRVSNVNIKKKKRYIKLKPLISSLLWNLHHENISFRSKVIPINYWKIPVPALNPPVYIIYKTDHFDYSCDKFMFIWIFLCRR